MTRFFNKQISALVYNLAKLEHTAGSMYIIHKRRRDSHQNLSRKKSMREFGMLAATATGATIVGSHDLKCYSCGKIHNRSRDSRQNLGRKTPCGTYGFCDSNRGKDSRYSWHEMLQLRKNSSP